MALPDYFHSLDILRGVAALSVVFWHWQHFFYDGTKRVFDPERYPLHGLFSPLYLYGGTAVNLFFCLSGFIFYWLYSGRIEKGGISAGRFAWLRFSRLYPLHFLTLCLVAAGQQFMIRHYGRYFVYPWNDAHHFVLQLFFASNWGLERGNSFNGPIWSVSVEVILYALFFVVCRLGLRSWWHAALFSGAGFILMKTVAIVEVGTGMFSFFIGGAVFHLFVRICRRQLSHAAVQRLVVFTGVMWIVIPLSFGYDFPYRAYRHCLLHWGANIQGNDVPGLILYNASTYSFDLVLFPLTILTLALWETCRGTLGKRVAYIGHLSYSSYLLHFPLQMVFMVAALHFTGGNAFFYSPCALLVFFSTLILLSLGCYRFIEMPCQAFLRGRVR